MTAATAHTWEVQPTAGHDRHGQSAVYDAETGKDIAIVYDGAAHGDLIAAAPELLEACKSVQSLLCDVWDHISEVVPGGPDAVNATADALFAAIAKAEGRL